MSHMNNLRYVASIKATSRLHLLPALPCCHLADNTRVCLEPSDPTCPSHHKTAGWPEDSLTEIELAFTGSSIPRPRPSLRAWGLRTRGGCKTATPANRCVSGSSSRRAASDRTCSCGNPARRLFGRATTHAACDADAVNPPARAAACDERATLGPRRPKKQEPATRETRGGS